MNYLLCMAGATALAIFTAALIMVNKPAAPVEEPKRNIVVEEDHHSYTVYRDEKTGFRIFAVHRGGAVILEKPIPVEGH